MYNGYNFYPPNGSAATSPIFLMPYSCQFDPIFMPCELADNDELVIESIQNSEMVSAHHGVFYD